METIIELSKTLAKLSGGFRINRLYIHYSKVYEMYEGFLSFSDDGLTLDYIIYEDGEIVKKSKTDKKE